MQIADENKQVQFLALSGHTHSKAGRQQCENLTVKAGSVEYTRPEIQKVITV